MSDEGAMNICECLWSRELSMQRLLNVIRNSQANCNDHECFETDNTNDMQVNFALVSVVMMALLFFFSYTSGRMRNRSMEEKSNNTGGNNFGGEPPAPPPTAL